MKPNYKPQVIQIGPLFDKLPPAALEAECALLGSMILDQRVISDVVEIIKDGDDFSKPGHSAIYEALVYLYDHNIPVDIVQVTQRLQDTQHLETLGGVDYLVMLAESVPSATSAPYYAKTVREKAMLRSLIDVAGRTLHTAYTTADPVAEQLDAAEQAIFALAEAKTTGEATDLNTLLQETYQKLENHDGKVISGLATGFMRLDELTSGLQNGELIIVAARPSLGKTAFAVNIAEYIACDLREPVAIFSLEMSKQQLAQRILCSRSGVDSHRLRTNMLRADDWQDLQRAVGELADAPMFIDDTPGLSLLALRAKARRLAARHHIRCIVVDYLQLMSGPKSDSREQEVSAMSRGIKALARELSVPVICLSQLNRGPESREGHRPRMSDLRESGAIEQDADVILMLHREDYYHRGDPDHQADNIAEVIIAKQRNGPTDIVKLQFDGGTTRFQNLAGNYAQEDQ